ncbi:MAG: bifunctional anthranilate synthase component I family protein/class IV aminotransferase, partial [Comamonadaceae bacterium]|nr:bifunctional anthranilate synthase component I family protein/class IV aminotransferase [Comamonadaceae bacterium]
QINFTFALHGRSWGQPLALYQRLRARQPSRYGALLHLPATATDGGEPQEQWVLSLSPELFLRCQGGHIQAQPMKGTAAAPAGDAPAQLQAAAQRLSQDAKSRAENIMIVDLLRNDLGRIAHTGSVQVPALFEVQRNGRVLGMTSTISAQLRPGVGLAQVLRASFPCGSITGAPKRMAMQYIDELERASPPTPRGLYTGALGWVERPAQAAPAASAGEGAGESAAPALDFCLSIPIRTLQLQGPASTGPALPSHQARLHVGAGIVWDSQAEQEWQECQLKAGFAVQGMAGLALFETMLLPASASLPQHWALHCARLQRSAQALGFASDAPGWQAQLQAYIAQQRPSATPGPWRLRLTLQQSGRLDIEHSVLAGPQAQLTQPVGLLLSPQPSRTPAWLRQHKTTLRQDYDAALRQAMAQGAFDCLFFNERGMLTEGARSNVFVQLDEAPDAPWLTPPVSDGLLPGIQRQLLLHNPDWHCQERSIHRQQLLAAKRVLVCNALRGPLQARIMAPAQQAFE